MLPRLFQLFSQLHRGLDVCSKGLGIGLAVARRLAELHDGSLEAFSEGLGRGSEFRLRLALYAQPATTSVVAESGLLVGPSRRVLIVDDNEDAARTLASLLGAYGHEAHVAFTGASAIEMAVSLTPDVVVLDIGLPDMDGVEVARRLREDSKTQGAILVAVTGWGQEDDRRRTAEAGVDRHLVKPVDPRALLDAVR